MRLGWAKTKYSVSYFIKKTIYVDGKNKDLVIKRLGSEKQICEKYGVTDAKAWAKEQVRLMNEAEKEDSAKFKYEYITSILAQISPLKSNLRNSRTYIRQIRLVFQHIAAV